MNMEIRATPLQDVGALRSADHLQDQIFESRLRSSRESAWQGLGEFFPSLKTRAAHGIVAGDKFNTASTAFDLVRTKLMQTLKHYSWKSVAITSPNPQCGKSFVALNLAFSLANLEDTRTVLMDMDLRDPSLATMLEMSEPSSMEAFLRGESSVSETLRRCAKNLAIGANSGPSRFSSEILQSAATTKALKSIFQEVNPDVVLYDMTSMLSRDDVLAFLPNVDCVILVAAAEQSTFSEIDVCERQLAERTNVVGVVLNKCQYIPGY